MFFLFPEIKDFEGYVGALSASESLTPLQHQLITKKLEKDLLHHLSLSKKDYSRAILRSEEKLAKDSELESIKSRFSISHFKSLSLLLQPLPLKTEWHFFI